MKRYAMILMLTGIIFSTTIARAQERGAPSDTPQRGNDVLRLIDVISAFQQTTPPGQGVPGQRGGFGARGANSNGNPDLLNEIDRILVNGNTTTINTPTGTLFVVSGISGAWWANNATAARLGLIDDQKPKRKP